jgi:hypothetical protein
MMRKISAADIRSDNPLEPTKYDRSDYSTTKHHSNLDYSGVLNDRSNKRHQEAHGLSANRHKQNILAQTPSQQYKDGRKSIFFIILDLDENKYISWTPNNYKISSPKSSIYAPGNQTQRDYNKNKVSSFQEQYQLLPKQN